jgi:ubiquinone/menaquinone biosynthesis C-methylase UbiE
MTDALPATTLTIQQLYTSTPESARFYRELEQSLHPRSGDYLLDLIAELGLGPDSTILDVGCGTAFWACRIAQRLPARILAIDPVPSLVATSRENVRAAGLADRITVAQGAIEQIPADPNSFDLAWSREMLGHVEDLDAGLRECARVLRRGGAMLVYHVYAGPLLEPREAKRLLHGWGTPPERLDRDLERLTPEHDERAFAAAGFRVVKKDVIASEFFEHGVERGERAALDGLLHAARLLRNRQAFVERYGEAYYEQALADACWFPFILLHKLLPVVYLLRNG